MLALPRVVRDAGEIEFTSGDKDLFELAVDEVAIDVEVVELQPSNLAAVGRETRERQAGSERADVIDGFEVSLHHSGGE